MKGVNWNPVAVGRTHPPAFARFAAGDAALMKQAGINVVRTYAPLSDLSVLDALWAQGIQVINTVLARGDTPLGEVERIVRAVGHHPAIMMWSIGNEWNYNGLYVHMSRHECMQKIRQVIQAVKRVDSSHPVSTVYGDLPTPHELSQLSEVDVWGVNYYNELTFSDLFDRWAAVSGKPMFLGEYGADAYDGVKRRVDEAAQAHATSVLTQEIMDHSTLGGGVCIGGVLFELTDEWWKDSRGSPHRHDIGGVAPGGGPHPDRIFNEEWWGILDVDRRPRMAFHAYAAVGMPRLQDTGVADSAGSGAKNATRLSCSRGGCTELPPPCHGVADCAAKAARAAEAVSPGAAEHAPQADGAGAAAKGPQRRLRAQFV